MLSGALTVPRRSAGIAESLLSASCSRPRRSLERYLLSQLSYIYRRKREREREREIQMYTCLAQHTPTAYGASRRPPVDLLINVGRRFLTRCNNADRRSRRYCSNNGSTSSAGGERKSVIRPHIISNARCCIADFLCSGGAFADTATDR